MFDALVTLLDDHSYDAISMADLASRAGIGRTAIYNHFADKDALIVAFASSETSTYLRRLEGVLLGVESATERLRAYVRHHIETQGEQHFGFGPEVHRQLSRESLVQIREHVLEVEAVLSGIVDEGVRSGEFRAVEPAAVVPLLQACLQPRHVDADLVADFVLRALRA